LGTHFWLICIRLRFCAGVFRSGFGSGEIIPVCSAYLNPRP
jgi:hypothetical protein